MDPLYRESIWRTIWGTILFLALIFLSAGTWHYWQGWLFFAVFAASTTGFTIYLALYDKPLLERRLKAGPKYEKEWSQRIIISLTFAAFLALLVVPVLDYRFGLSPVPAWVSILGNVIMVLGFLFIFWVIRVNSFAASNIRVERDHKVIDSGPYAFLRHPMYFGAIWLLIGIPLALGTWWSLGLIVLFFPILAWRILDEEKVLRRDLPGYTEYTERVRYRLVPYVW